MYYIYVETEQMYTSHFIIYLLTMMLLSCVNNTIMALH